MAPIALGMVRIPNDRVGVIEKIWSSQGSLPDGTLIALNQEAGYQADILRGGIHFGFWFWQYRVHKVPLTVVPQGKMGYVFARDGDPLPPEQTIGRVVPSNNYQDSRAFLVSGEGGPVGQRGRQRAILREGVYAINLALFVVITEDKVFQLKDDRYETRTIGRWQEQLRDIDGFSPVVVGRRQTTSPLVEYDEDGAPVRVAGDENGDTIAVITVHDGPSLAPGQIIAPPVAADADDANYHSNFQDIESFLRAGGCRGRQYVALTDGTYFINRWFATVELLPKTVVPIGHVGVVVSYFGAQGNDVSGETFRHGERVGEGQRGVQANTLGPGKYAFNTYAGRVHLVPTTNFVLHWVTGRTESHRYDESLKSIDLVTADAYEPVLPLSIVVHIDYQKAASVVQRFGDVKKLITQTLDPLLSAYFRDIAHKKTMLELLHDRDDIQAEARHELQHKFAAFDIELVDVLIGKPDTVEASGEIETLLEQLRLRQLSREQIETYERQSAAAEQLKKLKLAQAQAEMQTELTNSQVEIEIASNRSEAELATSRNRARQTVVTAKADNRRRLLEAQAESRSRKLLGEGESTRVSLEGESQARVLQQKIEAYGDPKLYALSLVSQYLSHSQQPLVPERLFISGASHNGNGTNGGERGLLGTLIDMLVAEKSGHELNSPSHAPAPAAATAAKRTAKATVDFDRKSA
ncbi:MAG: hypothetical protein KDA42_06785 [Planctomycetales bacterium]|nr:hypothetical protein [Planctomycetales bacterium]